MIDQSKSKLERVISMCVSIDSNMGTLHKY